MRSPITRYGREEQCPKCGMPIVWVSVEGCGYERRLEPETGRFHQCPANRPTRETTWQHMECLCGAIVLANDALTQKRDARTGEPHVCKPKVVEAQQRKAVAQRVAQPDGNPVPRGASVW